MWNPTEAASETCTVCRAWFCPASFIYVYVLKCFAVRRVARGVEATPGPIISSFAVELFYYPLLQWAVGMVPLHGAMGVLDCQQVGEFVLAKGGKEHLGEEKETSCLTV